MTHALHITLAQINPIVGDLSFNTGKIKEVISDCPENTDIVIFPEMAVCGYPPEDLILKPTFLDCVEAAVHKLAEYNKGSDKALIIPSPWRVDGKAYNAALVIANGEIQDVVLKHYLPNYGVFDEERIFENGPLPVPVTIKGHTFGILICEDMWYPDVAKHLKDKGAEILLTVNASPYEVEKNNQRTELAHDRVKETGLPLIYVNQCGGQDELVFDGASFVMNESGTVIMQAEEFVEDIHHTVWEKTKDRNHWLCLTNTSYPLHKGADAVYQAVMTGLRDYVAKNGFPGVIIGMSGGIDSALTAAVAVDALGPEMVHCVMMPSRYTSKESLEDAEAAAKVLGVHYDSISIEKTVEALEDELAPHFNHDTPGITYENLQSRSRGLILMALSNASGKMVLSTGNKSEMAVGYATLYGDMCGGFNAMKDLYKMQVYELSRWRNIYKPDHGLGPHGVVIPEHIITKPPSAELKPDQTDQDTLPPYEILDDILHCLIEKDMSVSDISSRGHDRETVLRIWKMLDHAEYKRRQAPPGVKITSRAFGRDRRYPITNHFVKNIDKAGN